MKLNSATKFFFAFAVAGILAACSTGQRAQTADVATRGAAGVSEMTGPTEAEILHVVMTVNNSEIEAAQLAKARSTDQEVISLANHIIKDHTAVNNRAMALAKRMNLEPDSNEISKSLQAGSATTMASLRNSQGEQFDQGYTEQQVKMHETVLRTIDNTLMPNAKNEELKALLRTSRTSVAAHLDHAKELQTLSGSSTQ